MFRGCPLGKSAATKAAARSSRRAALVIPPGDALWNHAPSVCGLGGAGTGAVQLSQDCHAALRVHARSYWPACSCGSSTGSAQSIALLQPACGQPQPGSSDARRAGRFQPGAAGPRRPDCRLLVAIQGHRVRSTSKAAVQRLWPIRPPARPTSARSSSGRPPASTSLGQSAGMFWLAGSTGLVVCHLGAPPSWE